ncbi:hypothetical protein Ocin01_05729 [Orchesella cincta]|uniref:Uncharacterized protein n=1 Tax=Orchesella cincta TaxID=48709 RepID=A0A1D2N6Q1_ORCCI|nr:hypothetical protein Ocin01_05729 [Orchesella cincta]
MISSDGSDLILDSILGNFLLFGGRVGTLQNASQRPPPPRIILKHLPMDDDQANIAVSVHHMDEAKVKIDKLCTVLAYVCMTVAFTIGIVIGIIGLSNTCLKSRCGRQNRPVPRPRASAAMESRKRIVIPSYDRLYYPQLVTPDPGDNSVFYIKNETTGEVF